MSFDCADLGSRVSVRYRLPDGMSTDVVGVLEHCDAASFGIRDRHGVLHSVSRADVVAGRVVPARPG